MHAFKDVDEYIAAAPKEVQVRLKEIRALIKSTAPEAAERIGYGMPGYYYNGPLVYFAVWKKHIGFYATPAGNEAFKKELAQYQGAKGSVQFPLDKPIPFDLIRKIVEFRMQEALKT